ncbi:hypothetical protein IFO69_18560 [Echinicola sp. CAU 1574]|uniref:Uncharacterized protein n=1 Tax=Echinicola arenosa TaxID=2774144 RepID=A0ABR9AQW8_9BACT|nr:hypothetical protein [Echinicola arenosa]MBD8490761.1 hypothetical protein [Echinicola arenosa]
MDEPYSQLYFDQENDLIIRKLHPGDSKKIQGRIDAFKDLCDFYINRDEEVFTAHNFETIKEPETYSIIF